ncbi:hypothetical protein Q5P01_018671 [Channa striata]|uniref:C-type lectin domain-containing protein n=1 Tax=Channa striata TaxID=64152 RepID=A0AA88M4W1_CHASR|nr:hypothetical protein Q5P01_018671 [Channa striata]
MTIAIRLCAAALCFNLCTATDRPEDLMTHVNEIFENGTHSLKEGRSRTMRDTTASKNCWPGWSKQGSRYFLYVNRAMSWADAEVYCQVSKANLASIHTPAEHTYIQELVRRQTGSYTEAWIGGTDAVKTWQWFWSDGSKFFYQDWVGGEPNNLWGMEKCIQINYSRDHRWNDLNCANRLPFICGTRPESC